MNKTVYKGSCPFCDTVVESESDKGVYYQMEEHLTTNHLDEAFEDLVKHHGVHIKRHAVSHPLFGWGYIAAKTKRETIVFNP